MKDSFSSLRRRPHSTPEQRAQWVRRYERSGLSQREFAERHRLSLFTLRNWIAQDGRRALAGRKGQPVWQALKREGLPNATGWAAEVVRPDGLGVRVAHDAPPAWREALLRSRPC